MSDLISALGYSAKTERRLRDALQPSEQIFNAIQFMGQDRFRMNCGGAFVVTAHRLIVFKTKILGRPEVDSIPWTDVSNFGVTSGYPSLILKAAEGSWRICIDASEYKAGESDEDRQTRHRDLLRVLAATMTEAREAWAAAEGARRSATEGDLMEELRKRRGF